MGAPSRHWRARYRRDRIVRDLLRRGWSQKTLAQRAGVGEMTVSRLLTGSAPVTVECAAKVADALGADLATYLYAQPDEISSDPARVGPAASAA